MLERQGFIVTMTGMGSYVASRNMELLREERRRQAEAGLTAAVEAARAAGLGLDDLIDLLRILYDES